MAMAARRWSFEVGDHPPRLNQLERSPGVNVSPGKRRAFLQWQSHQRKRWRSIGWAKASELEIPPLPKLRISVDYVRPRLGVADEDNDRGGLKHLVDGIVRAGVIPNDTRRYLEWGPVTESRGPKRLVVTLEEVI